MVVVANCVVFFVTLVPFGRERPAGRKVAGREELAGSRGRAGRGPTQAVVWCGVVWFSKVFF